MLLFLYKYHLWYHFCGFMYKTITGSVKPRKTVTVQSCNAVIYSARKKIIFNVFYNRLYFTFALRIVSATQMNTETCIVFVIFEFLCKNYISTVFANNHNSVFIVYNFTRSATEVFKSFVVCFNKGFCSKGF